MKQTSYNPDVLSCLANLSSDEVFTPPNLANQILDLLPNELWSNKDAKFLDPVTKTGVFLREIAKRLNKGLEKQIPDQQKRLDHIFKNQLYGIAITELTSFLSRRGLYCSKTANGKYSVVETFNDEKGNILFNKIDHTWVRGNCSYCGASEEVYSRGSELETHAYQFIHTEKPEEIFKNMKFDVIIGNPPYQLNDGGGTGMSAKPIYHKFIEQAIKLNPRFLTMIIPARWYSGGKGLDEFRNMMIKDTRISHLFDFENSNEVFPGVDVAGGICYFLWEKDYKGPCNFSNYLNGEVIQSTRYLNEFTTVIRHSRAIPIIKKVMQKEGKDARYLNNVISPRKPFGIPSNYKPKNSGIPCWFTQKQGLQYVNQTDLSDELQVLNKWKLLIPFAPIAGQTDFSKPIKFYYDANTRVAKPGECCSESWLVACAFSTEKEVLSFKSYLFTKVARFLLLQNVVSQNVTRGAFALVPDVKDYAKIYYDKNLIDRWELSKDEWEFIDSKIQ